MADGITQGKTYEQVQRDIGDALDLLQLKQDALKLGVSPDELQALQAKKQEYLGIARAVDQAGEAMRQQEAAQREMHDLIAGGVRDIGQELLDMARKGEFSFKRLADAAENFANRVTDRIFDQWADQLANLISGKPGSGAGGGFLGSLLSGLFGGGGEGTIWSSGIDFGFVPFLHRGGIAGATSIDRRPVPFALFNAAPRFHGGGMPGLMLDEVPAILQRGERVLSREETRSGRGMVVNNHITVRANDPATFRKSQGQIAADMAREIKRAQRNL